MKPMSEDPKDYGLPSRVVLRQVGENHLALVIERRSRIIMADGRRILLHVEAIRRTHPDVRVSLMTSAPVCSKTQKSLEERGVLFVSS